MIHHRDGVAADHRQGPDQVLTPLVVIDVGEHRALAKLVHHGHRAHGDALEIIGGVLQRGDASAGRVSVDDETVRHGTYIECRSGIASAQLRRNNRRYLTAQEALQLLHVQQIHALVRLSEAGVLFLLFLGQRADGAAGIGRADHGLGIHFIEGHQPEFLSRCQRFIDAPDSFLQASAAPGAEDGAAQQDIHQVFPVQFSHLCSLLTAVL